MRMLAASTGAAGWGGMGICFDYLNYFVAEGARARNCAGHEVK